MIAVIAGSTGLVGSLLLSKLLKDKVTTQVISVTRKPLGLTNPKLKEVIVSDFANLMDHKDELRGDVYFCALGTTIKTAGSKENFKKVDYDAIVNFGKVAEYNQAQSLIVVSASMANAKSAAFYNQVKGETEEALKNLKINRLVLLRPGLLMGERAEKRTGEKLAITLMNILSSILPSKLEKTIATKIETLTARMIKEGENPAPKIKIINAVDI